MENPYYCHFCNVNCKSKGKFDAHLTTKKHAQHYDPKRVHACKYCDYTTYDDIRYKEHVKKHIEINNKYECAQRIETLFYKLQTEKDIELRNKYIIELRDFCDAYNKYYDYE